MSKIINIYRLLKEADSFEGAHDIYTPQALVDSILSLLDLSKGAILVWHNVEFVASLIHTYKVDPARITLYADHPNKIIWAKHLGANYTERVEKNMKFDIVLGNPPYDDNIATTVKLWPGFLKKSIELLNDGGHMGFVTPRAWIERPNSQLSGGLVKEIFKVYQIEQVDITAEEHFNVGESPCSYLIHKIPKHTTTRFIFKDRVEDIDYVGQKVPLNDLDTYKVSIFNKVQAVGYTRMSSVVYSDTGTALKIEEMLARGVMSRATVGANDVKVFWTASQDSNFFMPLDNTRTGIKVIINRSGYFYKDSKPDHYIRLDKAHEYGIGAGAFGITVQSDQEGYNLISLLTSKLYQWYIKHEKTGGYNTGIAKLPLLDISKPWTDTEIFKLFNINTAEQDIINAEF